MAEPSLLIAVVRPVTAVVSAATSELTVADMTWSPSSMRRMRSSLLSCDANRSDRMSSMSLMRPYMGTRVDGANDGSIAIHPIPLLLWHLAHRLLQHRHVQHFHVAR